MKTSLRRRIDNDIAAVDEQLRERRRRPVLSSHDPDVPTSSLWMSQKLGFKPLIHCTCGGILDLNTTKRKERQAWLLFHQDCTPRGVTS